MYELAGVKTSPEFAVPTQMKAWVLGDPDQLLLCEKPTPVPGRAEVLVRIDAVAICATDLEIIHSGSPASIGDGLPFNKNFTPGHEYMGTVTPISRPFVKSAEHFFWQPELPSYFRRRFQPPCLNRARFFG
jgi:threonine dehydrogenase-like Zn-dependent dehydrogenase